MIRVAMERLSSRRFIASACHRIRLLSNALFARNDS
jgi:hypothetical protein